MKQRRFFMEFGRWDWLLYIAVIIFFIVQETNWTALQPQQRAIMISDPTIWKQPQMPSVPESTVILCGTAAFVILVVLEFFIMVLSFRNHASIHSIPPDELMVSAALSAIRLGLAGATSVLATVAASELFSMHVGDPKPGFGYQCLGSGGPPHNFNTTFLIDDSSCRSPVREARQGFLSLPVSTAFSFAIFCAAHAVSRTARISYMPTIPPLICRILYQLYLVFVLGLFLMAWGVAQDTIVHNQSTSFSTFGSMILATSISLGVFYAIDSSISRDIDSDLAGEEHGTKDEKVPFA